MLSYEDYSKDVSSRLPRHGIVELFVQKTRLAWPKQVGGVKQVRIQNFTCPAVFLSRGNASTLYSALEAADPCISLQSLLEATAFVDVVVVFLGSHLSRRYSVVWPVNHHSKPQLPLYIYIFLGRAVLKGKFGLGYWVYSRRLSISRQAFRFRSCRALHPSQV